MSHTRSPQKSSFQFLEDYVKRFVGEKTGLRVRLDLQTEWACVKSLEAGGSIALAMFWAKVLQHRDNYPTDKVHYHRSRDSQTGADRLLIRVEDVTLCLNLSTGLLEISGPHALLWLKKRFLALLRAYDGLKDTEDWYGNGGENEDDDIRRLALRPTQPALGDCGTDLCRSGVRQPGDDDGALENVWLGQPLESRLERTKIPSVQPTADFVHPLLRSLLCRWLADEHTQVCLITAELDSQTLRAICQLACRHKSTASFSLACVPFRADPRSGRDLPAVRLEALRGFGPQEQMWLEYKLLRQFTSPRTASGLNLVAGLRLGHAEVLLTSAPLHSTALAAKSRADLVQFLQLTESLFVHDFVQPLNAAAAE